MGSEVVKPKSEKTTQEAEGLLRELGLLDSTAIVVGSIIGSGIFLVPSVIARQLPSLGVVLLAWLVGGLLSLFGALSLAELGAAYPRAGGLYVYLEEAYGKPAGFLYGWGLLSMIHSGTIATLAAAFSLYFAGFFHLSSAQQKALGIGGIALLTCVNCLGIRTGKLVQNVLTLLKLGGLALVTVLLLSKGRQFDFSKWSASLEGSSHRPWAAFGLALVAVLWAYEGWHVVSFTAGEIRQPRRNLPLSLLLGTMIIIAVYLLANLGYYAVLAPREIQLEEAVASAAVSKVAGTGASAFVSLLILVSIFGAMNGFVLTGPRVYYAMARDGLFFSAFSRVSERFHTPAVAIIVQGAWASLLTLLGTFQQLFSYVIFTAWIFYGLCVAGVIVLRRTRPKLDRPFCVPLYPWLPVLFCLAALGITINTILADASHGLLGIALILVGAPVYALFRHYRNVRGERAP